jgi:hypothetical protein
MDAPGILQWNKGPKLKTATMSEEGEDIQQDLQEDRRSKEGELPSDCGK